MVPVREGGGDVSPEVREAASRWLLGLNPAEAVAAWTDAFASGFDRIFGERHLSWTCFRRSCLASLLSVAVVMLVWGALEPREFRRVFDASAGFGVLLVALIFPVLTAGLNFLPDYLSLLETRWAIQRMRAGGSPVAYLPLDFVATAMIAAMIVLPLFSLIPGTGVVDVLPALFSLSPEGTEAGSFGIVMADRAGDGGH